MYYLLNLVADYIHMYNVHIVRLENDQELKIELFIS